MEMGPHKDRFNSHPGQSFSLSLCGPISISRANAHMVHIKTTKKGVVHRGGSWTGSMKGSMDRVHRDGPWTWGPCFVYVRSAIDRVSLFSETNYGIERACSVSL